MKEQTEKRVSAIENGTVIDHIPATKLFQVASILLLDKVETPVTVGTNLKSNKLGKKGIIKIADKYFEEEEINKISLIAPQAVINIIKGYEVVEKRTVKIPNKIKLIAKCVNPKCITNVEEVGTKFDVVNKEKIALKCNYCEKITSQEHIVIL